MNGNEIKTTFVNPPAAYRGKPFWAWNGELEKDELIRQGHIMKEMGLGGYFMHSRSGLITEYLGDEWFQLINDVADAAEKDGMEAWLYDEDRWPSGSAGGKVTRDPAFRRKALYLYETDGENYDAGADWFKLYAAKVEDINLWAYEQVSSPADMPAALARMAASPAAGEVKVLRFAIVPDAPDSNYNGTTYIDTMSRKATDRFIELTHEEYRKRCGDRLGTSIKGIFTDEPERGTLLSNLETDKNGSRSVSICWTEDMFDEFRARLGYDAEAILPELFYRYEGKKVAPVKHDYINLAQDLFLERFADPINDWCDKNKMIFTGHVLHEDWLMAQTVPQGSLMRFYEHMTYPGIDCLGGDNDCYWIARQLLSAARQIGKKWLLSEMYGVSGWNFNFKGHKAMGDWQALYGINLRCPHLSWYTMEGEAKRDYPSSILHQSPWYPYYSKVESYFARFGLMMSEGKANCDILVLNPIESLWCQCYLGWAQWICNNSKDVEPIEKRYIELFHMLADNHVEFDYGDEDMMSRLCRAEKDENGKAVLHFGEATYTSVLVTDMLTMRASTLKILKEFADLGGKVVFAGEVPAYVDSVESAEPELLAKRSLCVLFETDAVVGALREDSLCNVHVLKTDGSEEGRVFTQLRRDFGGNGYVIALVNTDRENACENLTLKVQVPSSFHAQMWDMESGERYDADSMVVSREDGLSLAFSLEAVGSACFVFTEEKEALPAAAKLSTVFTKAIEGKFNYQKDETNVCVLDFCRWRMNGGAWSERSEALKADQQIRDSLGLERRGGSMLQPWFSKLNDTQKYGELELEYDFDSDSLPEGELFLAGERPETNAYAINGVPLTYDPKDGFYIDACFKKLRVPAGTLKKGENTVTVKVTFMRTTNVESLYLLGEFGVNIHGTRRALTALPEQIGFGGYAPYHMPFYTGGLRYLLTKADYADIASKAEEGSRVFIGAEGLQGSCFTVTALGKTSVCGWAPYEIDVTDAVRAGADIEFTVVGTRKNLFGPLHETPIQGNCGPGNFVTEGENWTDEYMFVPAGTDGIRFSIKK